MEPRSDGQVLLLQPWVEDFYGTDCRVQPIGLGYLAGSLAGRFPELAVEIYDALAGGGKRSIAWPREFSYLKRYYGHPDRGPFALFHQYYRFGDSDETIVERLARYDPFLIGISSLFSPYYRESLSLARLCRRVFPGVPVVMGGSHASLHPASLLAPGEPFARDGPLCDYVLRGECEESICELVEHLLGRRDLSDVTNLVDRGNLDSCRTTPVAPRRERIPEPRFPGLDPSRYTYRGRRMTFLITSRSCPHRCTFCSIHSVFGWNYETRSVESIIGEIRRRYAEGIRHFDIEDDNFTFRRSHTLELLERIAALRLPISFSAMNGVSYFSLDREALEKMWEAGFETLNVALVSSDATVLRFTKRPHTVARFREVVAGATELGFRVTAYYILGMPGQTVDEMWGTLKTLASTRCLVGASPFYFTPGSPIHEREKDSPRLRLASRDRDPLFSARLTALDVETEDFRRDDVYTCFRMTRLVNHVKEGIDRGLPPDHEHFAPAIRALGEKLWHAESRARREPLPFSARIARRLDATPLEIAGFRTDRRLVWDPGAQSLIKV